jgi:Glutaredoxin-like domain (DUF836)
VAPSPLLVLYRRAGCHLCDEARATVNAIVTERATAGRTVPEVVERDIDADDELQRRFSTTIPVVDIGDRRLELAVSPSRLRRFVTDALDATPVLDPSA